MQRSLSSAITMGLFLMSLLPAQAAPQAQTPDLPHSREIAEVEAGTRREAHASWWGFNQEDATDTLQKAIDSKVPTLIVDNTGSEWLVNKSLQLVSNQKIIFADGVVVRAKPDHFKAIGASLIRGNGVENVTLTGEGTAVLMMNKKEYQDPTRYKQGEWRHAVNLGGCTNITIRNLTIKESGGDGLYVGAGTQPYCENILVENVVFDGHHRLGMAVISARNLMVRRCRFINALGASPMGGIDFEPNNANERLVNCVVEDSVFSANIKGAGVSVSPNHLNSESAPVSVTLKRCTMNDNALGIFLYPTRRSTSGPATGQVEFIDCRLKNNPVLFQDPVANGIKIVFKNCTIDNRSSKKEALSIVCKEAQGRAIGNVIFDHTTVLQDGSREPIAIKYQGSGEISDTIRGTLFVQQPERRAPFDLVAFTQREKLKFQKINAQEPSVFQAEALTLPPADAARQGNAEVFLRGKFTFLQWAEKGQTLTVNARAVQVGPYFGDTQLTLHSPDDTVIKTYTLPPDGQPRPLTFTATATGFYRVTCNGTVQRIDIDSPHRGNGILVGEHQTFLPFQGRLYFQVPAGVKEFSLGVAADAGADVALLDPNGKEIMKRQNIDSMELFSAVRADADKSEIWSIALSKVVWQVTVRLYTPLPALLSTNPNTLPLAQGH